MKGKTGKEEERRACDWGVGREGIPWWLRERKGKRRSKWWEGWIERERKS